MQNMRNKWLSMLLMSSYIGRIVSIVSVSGVIWGIGISQINAAADLAPWTERDLELYPRFDYAIFHYDSLAVKDGEWHHVANGQFFRLGVSGSYTAWSLDLEGSVADTRHRSFGFNDLRLMGRYQWMNDNLGDPVSLMTGITLMKVAKQSVNDLSLFNHGENGVEVHVSCGRESICLSNWTSRWWGVAGIGVADHGSPWLKGDLGWEKHLIRIRSNLRLRIFAESLWGLGGRSLCANEHFHGYGPIAHGSVDLGSRLTYETDDFGRWVVEYIYRPWVQNGPKYCQQGMVRLVYPFGL